MVQTIPEWKQGWIIRFSLKVLTTDADHRTNIIHLSDKDNESTLPAVWFEAGTTKLVFSFPTTSSSNTQITTADSLELDKWYEIQINHLKDETDNTFRKDKKILNIISSSDPKAQLEHQAV